MKKIFILTALILLLLFSGLTSLSASETLVQDLKSALDDIGESHYERLVVAFGNFTYRYTTIGGSFSRFIQEELESALDLSSYYELFVIDALENLDADFREVYGGLFNVEGVEALLSGTYAEEDDHVLLSLEIISFKTGSLVGKREIRIPRGEIPAGISLLPSGYRKALELGEELSDVLEAGNSGLVVKAFTNRGEGAVYRDGEELVITFFTNLDAYVKIYHIDVEGEMSLIFPNQFHADNLIPAQTLINIPDKDYPFSFVLGEPYGTEYIKIIASTSQFPDIEESFETLGKANRSLLSRGLSVTKKKGLVTESLLSYTIVE
jgi:hypothetical protein